MDRIRIAFFDIDGTLVDFHAKQLSHKTVEALTRLRSQGVILCLATGRSPLTLPHFPEIEFDAFLTFNGSYCFDRDQVLFSNPIPHRDIRKLIKNAADINRPVCIATRNRLAANGTDKDLVDYFMIGGCEIEVADDFEALLQEEIYQIMLGCYKLEYSLMMKDIHHAKIAAWWDRAVDIIPANGGKGIAVQKVLEQYHLDPSEAIAFGDGNNDIEMLQTVGTGIAMGNASQQLKAVADDVCGHVAQDGIYHYCLEAGLI
ncbi:MAG: Cof-type HAD-IIB family hydrolase [Eubacteriales bacterium]|nr:Cof-type HAD-IIB family hydrolase [Eubacteriales bacterium]